VTSTVFSQTDTTKKKTFTFTEDMMKKIIKDLIRKDSLEAEVQVCKNNTTLYQQNIQSKDFIISIKNEEIKVKDSQIVNLNTAIRLKDTQNQNLQKNIDELNIMLKKANKKVVTRTVVGGAIITALTYLLLKH
jgi:uncharacterized protein (DUF3084 family)